MEYIVKYCPECKGELHAPKEIKTCVCMYCGKSINLSEDAKDALKETPTSIQTEYQKSKDRLMELVGEQDRYLKNFTKNNYSSSFEEYQEFAKEILLPMERYAAVSDGNKEEVLRTCADKLVTGIDQLIMEKTKGALKNKGDTTHQYRYFLAVYMIPMIRSLNLAISEQLAETIIQTWCSKYPDYIFYKADYNELLAGFSKKGFCFITTAVCTSLGKDDDCTELNKLRAFRDHYMMKTKEDKELVEEYYQQAPAIVAIINTTPGSNEKYRYLWKNYLKPCLEDIENNRLEECKLRYVSMMRSLKASLI